MARFRVVGLGQIESAIVSPVLGADIEYVESPSQADIYSADGVLVRASYVLDSKAIAAMPSLKVIARTGVGTDLVDVAYAQSRNIPVVITPGANSRAVAEGVMAHLLHLTKRLGPLTREIRDGNWPSSSEFPVGDLEGASIGLIGYGRIGKLVAELASAFGMQVLVFDPYSMVPDNLRVDSLDRLLPNCDSVSLHVPLNDETRNLLDASAISSCKPGVILINCSRGGLLDLDAALLGLRNGQIGGLGLDVFDVEPPRHHAVFDHENVVLTPHRMGLSRKATMATYVAAAKGVRAVLEGRTPEAVAG